MADGGNNKLPAPPGRLRSVAISCWRIFEQCTRSSLVYSHSGAPSDTLTYDYGRFRIWCGNLGVRQGGHASLDWRLRDAEAMEATIFAMLRDLEDDLQQCLSITTKATSPVSPTSDEELSDLDEISPTEELQLRSEAIASTIKSLYEMSFSIRNQSTRRLAYAKAQNYHPRDPDEEALLQSFLPHDQRHVEDFFKDLRRGEENSGSERSDRKSSAVLEDDSLKQQCVAAITARRRQLAYWKNHDRKLQSEGEADQPEIAETLFSGTQASGVFKQTTTELVENRSIVSSIASTVRDIDGNEALFPGPPKRASEHDAFVCSYCSVLCGPEDAKYSRWRKHIREDLQPYFCTFPGCPEGLRSYGNHHDWADHEQTAHEKALADRTQCPICLLPAAELPGYQTFAKHLASHLERLSVACLPLDADFGEEENDEGDASDSSGEESGITHTPLKVFWDFKWGKESIWDMFRRQVKREERRKEWEREEDKRHLSSIPGPQPDRSRSSRDEDEVTSSDVAAQPIEQMDWRVTDSIASLVEWAKKRNQAEPFDTNAEMEEFADNPSEAEEEQTIPNESEARRQELEHGMEAHTLRTREAVERDTREFEEDVASQRQTTSADLPRAREKLKLIRGELERRGHDTEEDIASREETTRTNLLRTREEIERNLEEVQRSLHETEGEVSFWKKEVEAQVRKEREMSMLPGGLPLLPRARTKSMRAKQEPTRSE